MKTKEELNALKEEIEALSKKLAELTVEELEQVAGGNELKDALTCCPKLGKCNGGENCLFFGPEHIPDDIRCPFRKKLCR